MNGCYCRIIQITIYEFLLLFISVYQNTLGMFSSQGSGIWCNFKNVRIEILDIQQQKVNALLGLSII